MKRLNNLKTDDITLTMPPHRLLEWKQHVTALEKLSTSSFEKILVSACSNEPNIPVRHSTDAIASTSGVTTMNKDIDNHSDEVNTSMEDDNFGTENADYLESHIVPVSLSDSSSSLPELHTTCLKTEENQEAEPEVTVFRAINETRNSRNIFERNDYYHDSTLDISTDSNQTDFF